ncbi:uncharacterized protein LOC116256988 [Nymphaea colorata]|uniref:uncharacterized protein LOC116256988 n=1 Tax=Nymphaea colorata TaxID=210225 RepID=UPI00129E3D7D|nr:uncharacterized protein LOC116256988 [Nymphaea colorata]
MATRCIFITFLLLSLILRSTPAAASPASSNEISTLSPVSVQGMDITTGIIQANPRKLAGGGRSGGGGGSRGGGGGRSGGVRVIPRTGAYGKSSASPRNHCLEMTMLTVLATSLMIILLL